MEEDARMADQPPYPGDDSGEGPDRGSSPGARRWVKWVVIVAIILAVLFVVLLHLLGGGLRVH
jgi:hypothetical protein